jgi:type IV secretory pathway VirB4 component
VDSDANRWQQRQNANNNFTANLPYQMEQMRKVGKEYMDDLTERDQRMMFAVVTLTHLADSLEQLDQDTESLQSRTRGCEFSILKYQQEDGLNTVLPYGLRRIEAVRTLTTESTAVLMPFKSQEIQDRGGIYYGVNAVSHNLIICNRGNLLNGNGFILGVSGSGKSMAAKQEFASLALSTDHDLIVVDPEREYGPLVRAMGGEVITISASSAENSYINALDLSSEYGDGKNPLVLKSEFIMSLCEQLMGSGEIGAKEKSIIDRCTANIYREYIKDYKGDPPTLKDLHKDLMMQKEPAAHDIALALELFTTGSLNVFSHQTSINTNNRILCFDIQDLGENLKPIGLLVMLDAIFNRVIRNRHEGKFTHVYIDEIYLFFANNGMGSRSNISSYSGEFLYKCWKRFRKYGATLTGITQNVEECLLSDTARMMFANSEFLLMFNQAATDREELSRLLGTSDTQMDYVSDAPAGHGLIKVGGGIVPFINEFPKDTALYWLMTTKPGEE